MSELAPPPQVLGYAMPDVRVRLAWLLRVGRLTGRVPLIVGVSTTVLWLITRADFLMIVGLWTIIVGTFATAAGVICTLIYFCANRLPDPSLRKTVKEETVWSVALNLLNYPAAVVCFLFVASAHP
jgi:hypothetical protein